VLFQELVQQHRVEVEKGYQEKQGPFGRFRFS